MKSLILTSLYLCKDTLYRWKERPSSPLSRVLVVFFLSLCALSFLANYVLTTKMVVDEIRRQGGDLVVMTEMEDGTAPSKVEMIREGLPELCDAQLLILNDVAQGSVDGNKMPIVEYSDYTLKALKDLPLDNFPYLVLVPQDSSCVPGPVTMRVGYKDEDAYYFPLVCRRMPDDSILSRAYPRGIILVPEGASGTQNNNSTMSTRRYLVRVAEMTYENVHKVQQTMANLSRLDGTFSTVIGSASSLEKLDIILGNQTECRAGFSIGIAVIVGILLTALASMEFRQNEYVYTLMKSFGVNPFLLVLTFIAENVVLVGMAFVAAIISFLQTQKIVLGEFFKLHSLLTYEEIEPEVALLGGSLIVCVLISTIPIAISAYREIGRVLK